MNCEQLNKTGNSDPTLESGLNERNRPESPSQDSDDSSSSFHSFKEQLQNLNVGNEEFSKPTFMQNDNKEDSKWFDTSETISDEKENIDLMDIYFVDEEYLKDLEITATEEEKNIKQNEALEIKNNANQKFKEHLYEEAAMLYTDALRICPISSLKDRAVLYANRAVARSKSNLSKEQLKDVIKDCDKAIENDPSYLKAILRRANLLQQADNLDEALKDFQRVLELDPKNMEAREAVMVLPQKINERNEKLKEEMMGKLKDLGNMILKPFGLSTNNFELKQDPNSGGYNINFQQNPS